MMLHKAQLYELIYGFVIMNYAPIIIGIAFTPYFLLLGYYYFYIYRPRTNRTRRLRRAITKAKHKSYRNGYEAGFHTAKLNH